LFPSYVAEFRFALQLRNHCWETKVHTDNGPTIRDVQVCTGLCEGDIQQVHVFRFELSLVNFKHIPNSSSVSEATVSSSIKEELPSTDNGATELTCAECNRDFPGYKDGKGMSLAFAGKQIDTPSGIKAGALSTNHFRSPRFRNRVRDPNQEYCVPDEVILCNDTNQGMYCHLLCALAKAPEIVKVYGTFAGAVQLIPSTNQGHMNHGFVPLVKWC
jgi:hypothetical protein